MKTHLQSIKDKVSDLSRTGRKLVKYVSLSLATIYLRSMGLVVALESHELRRIGGEIAGGRKKLSVIGINMDKPTGAVTDGWLQKHGYNGMLKQSECCQLAVQCTLTGKRKCRSREKKNLLPSFVFNIKNLGVVLDLYASGRVIPII